MISDHKAHSTPRKKSTVVKKAKTAPVRKASASKPARKATSKLRSPPRVPAGRHRHLPSRKARRSGRALPASEPKGGRNTLDGVDYTLTDGWNAREGSAPDKIVKALRKFRGNRTKVFEARKSDVWFYVGKKKANGTKRTKADAEAMLKYRISRTAWDLAMRTGQHKSSSNRVEYGTGGTGNGTFKPARVKPAAKAKAKPKAKPASKPATRQKPAQRRTTARKAAAPAKRGRPKASSRR